jgi:hypothetical protein
MGASDSKIKLLNQKLTFKFESLEIEDIDKVIINIILTAAIRASFLNN